MWTGLSLGPSLSKAKDQTGLDLQTLAIGTMRGDERERMGWYVGCTLPCSYSGAMERRG